MSGTLRSAGWFAGDDEVAMLHRVAVPTAAEGRPVIGIADPSSDLNPCHGRHPEIAEAVADAVAAAGGVPVRFPVMSLGEDLMKPSAMLYRNLLAMEIEETARSNPLDGLVLLAGCDKSVPAALMAAASIDLPAILALAGARAAVDFRGRPLGTGTDLWRALEERRAGHLDDAGWRELEHCLACAGPGTCNTMGTASSMAAMTEALGMALPGWTGVRARGEEVIELARRTGEQAVRLVRAGSRPSDRITQRALDNAIRLLAAIGGSTNAVVHLLALSGRLGIDLSLEDFDRIGMDVPLLANLEPSGKYLMEDLFRAGGPLAVLQQVRDLLDPTAITVTGEPLVSYLAGNDIYDTEVIAERDQPVQQAAGIAVLRGNLAPDGAIIKPAAASPELLQHRGRAVVFDSIEDVRARLDDPDLDVDADSVLVLRGCGPKGYPGMPEVANLPIPRKLLAQGVRDMVRVCDGRMSGTAYGTVVLHVAPEAAAGGPLALVQTGDIISLDVRARTITLEVSDEELASRTPPAAFAAGLAGPARGWERLYVDHVQQADTGVDLDFLVGSTGPVVGRESH